MRSSQMNHNHRMPEYGLGIGCWGRVVGRVTILAIRLDQVEYVAVEKVIYYVVYLEAQSSLAASAVVYVEKSISVQFGSHFSPFCSSMISFVASISQPLS